MNEPPTVVQIQKLLDWCLHCPSLLAPDPLLWPSQDFAKSIDWQKLNAAHIERIQRASQDKLGSFFEALVTTLFELLEQYHIIAENRVIQSPQRTLGEIDLLLQDSASQEVIHLELAIKFYLWVPAADSNAWHWVGAGLKDFFTDKCQRLYQHQLHLPQLAAQQSCWPSELPLPDRQCLWIPGRLYLPEEHTLKDTVLAVPKTPWWINPDALTSYWQPSTPDTEALYKWQWLTGEPGTGNPIRPPFQCAWRTNQPLFVVPENWHTNALQRIIEKRSRDNNPETYQ